MNFMIISSAKIIVLHFSLLAHWNFSIRASMSMARVPCSDKEHTVEALTIILAQAEKSAPVHVVIGVSASRVIWWCMIHLQAYRYTEKQTSSAWRQTPDEVCSSAGGGWHVWTPLGLLAPHRQVDFIPLLTQGYCALPVVLPQDLGIAWHCCSIVEHV